MTPFDRARFGEAMGALNIAFRVEHDDLRLAAYFSGLKDIPLDHVLEAMREAMKRSEYYPKIAELRSLADKARETDCQFLPPSPDDRAEYNDGKRTLHACNQCEDTGFVPRSCTPEHRCGNRMCEMGGYPEHQYVTVCLCRQTNPVIQRHVATLRKYRKELPR